MDGRAAAALEGALAGVAGPDLGDGGAWAFTGAVWGAVLACVAAPPVMVGRARRRGAG